MGARSQKMKRTENFRDYINKILRNQEMDCDEEWWEQEKAWSELQALACAGENYVTDSIKLNINIESKEKLIIAVFWKDPDGFFKAVGEKIQELAKAGEATGIELVFFVRDMKSRISLERTFDAKAVAGLRKTARKSSGSKELWLHCSYILQKEYDSQEVKLTGIRRYEMMQMPPIEGKINQERLEKNEDSGERINALVFTVDLYQLAGLYNLIGDRLFKNNVRFGISETLGVDHSILRTLETEPELFWFKNNGVTILVENPDFMPRNVEELKLDEIGPEKDPGFSVVNGAQTITTSAKYFFNMEYNWQNSREGTEEKSEYLKKLNRSKQAQVILRIIQISEGKEGKTASNTAKDISVALNRQKPIKMEDIAFTLGFVEKLARYLERVYGSNPEGFLLVRRGEESGGGDEMDLVEFARATLACVGQPGEARSQGAKALLKIKTEDMGDTFQRKDIFVPEWEEADDLEEAIVFRRCYGAVLFAHKTAGEYEIQRKAVIRVADRDFSAVINNGKWYFTAVLVWMLNGLAADFGAAGRKSYDFSDFGVSFSSVREKIPKAMEYFGRIVVLYTKGKEEYGELNSNLFKKDDLYNKLTEEMARVITLDFTGNEESGIEEEIWKLAGLFSVTGSGSAAEIFAAGDQAAAAVEEARGAWLESAAGRWEADDDQEEPVFTEQEGTGKKQAAPKMEYVVLKGKKYPCKRLAQAQADTVRYILENYDVPEGRLEACSDWLTSQQEKGETKEKYFRSAKRIEVKGQEYWVGTSSNLETKRGQARALCEAAQVGENEIFWYMDSLETPVFSW